MNVPAEGAFALPDLRPHAFRYETCDIPPGMTIREYQARRSGNSRGRERPAPLRRMRALLDTSAHEGRG